VSGAPRPAAPSTAGSRHPDAAPGARPADAPPGARPADAPPGALCLRTASAAQTRDLGAALAGALRPGDVVLLGGDLGSGKTTLTQGMAGALGVDGQVTSPTFTLVRSHPCRRGGAVRTLLHADLYRLDRLAEVADLAIGELVEDGAVAVVEWGDVAGPVLGADALAVVLVAGPDDDERWITLDIPASWWARRHELADRLEPWTAR